MRLHFRWPNTRIFSSTPPEGRLAGALLKDEMLERSRTPRFNIGDQVQLTTPGSRRGQRGVVVDIIQPTAGDFVYRYRVHFLDGTSGTFFGFELEGAIQRAQAS